MQTPFYRTQKFHKYYLKVCAFVVGSFGPVFFLGTMPASSEAARWTLDFLSWPIDGVQIYTEPTTRLLSALAGGFLFGWGVMIWCLSIWVYDKAPEFVRRSVMIGLLSWFVMDSAGSVTSGNISNVFFNVVILIIASGPLWLPAKDSKLNVNGKKIFSSGSIFEDEVGYSRAVRVGDFIFLSGCTGFNYETSKISDNVQEQCEQTILNIQNALGKAGVGLENIVKTVFYFSEPSVFNDCKPVFKKYFGDIRPTLTAVGAQLHDDRIKLEIEVTAITNRGNGDSE